MASNESLGRYPNYPGKIPMLKVLEYYPPPDVDDPRIWIKVVIYALLFTLGVCGNTSVLTKTGLLVYTHNVQHRVGPLVCLCLVEIVHLLTAPMIILEHLVGYWLLGTPFCKLYFLLDSSSKIVSPCILLLLNFESYSVVCWPHRPQLRGPKLLRAMQVTLAVLAIALLVPSVCTARAEKQVLREFAVPGRVSRIVVQRCNENVSYSQYIATTLGSFLFCFLTPLILNITFACNMFCRNRNWDASVRMRAFSTLGSVLLYYSCWTPYWVAQFYSIFLESSSGTAQEASPYVVYIMHSIHALTYLNSATNWILYGRLNQIALPSVPPPQNRPQRPTTPFVEQEGSSRGTRAINMVRYRTRTQTTLDFIEERSHE